jgi:TonB family protein
MQSQRLVIRIKLPAQGQTPAPTPPRFNKNVLLIAGVLAVLLLGWAGISMLGSDPMPAPAPVQAPVAEPAAAEPAEPAVVAQPDAPPSPIDEVIPDVPRSALNTISGTIRVTIRVTIDEQGAVVDAATIERGPSRYFERLSLEAARKWTFTPANSQAQRSMLVRFYFRRSRVSAEAEVP